MYGMEMLKPYESAIRSISKQHGASNIRVFGSVARGEATSDSDIDLLVDMDSSRTLLDTIGLVQDLQDTLGRRVDVVTSTSLHRLLKAKILSEALPL